jgi:hypothetical protein
MVTYNNNNNNNNNNDNNALTIPVMAVGTVASVAMTVILANHSVL